MQRVGWPSRYLALDAIFAFCGFGRVPGAAMPLRQSSCHCGAVRYCRHDWLLRWFGRSRPPFDEIIHQILRGYSSLSQIAPEGYPLVQFQRRRCVAIVIGSSGLNLSSFGAGVACVPSRLRAIGLLCPLKSASVVPTRHPNGSMPYDRQNSSSFMACCFPWQDRSIGTAHLSSGFSDMPVSRLPYAVDPDGYGMPRFDRSRIGTRLKT